MSDRVRLLPTVTATFIAVLLAAILVLPGCNTLEGAGEDMEDAGEEIQEAAD